MATSLDRDGWIQLHREIIDSKLWSCSDATFRVAIYLLLEANHEPAYTKSRVYVKRGQCVRSITRISDDCYLSRKAVRYALKVLQEDEFLVIDYPQGAQRGHRITICKYDTYQAKKEAKGTDGSSGGSSAGSSGGTTNNNENNGDNENNENSEGAPANKNTASRFEEFWQVYPKKKGKKPCQDKWKSKQLDDKADMLIADVQKRKEQDKSWIEGYIPNPHTYIHQERWTDEIEPVNQAKAQQLNQGGTEGVKI